MPRANSSSRSPVPRSPYKPATVAPPPKHISTPITPAPVPTTVHHTVEAPTLGQSMKQGFGWGMGSAIAHRIFGATPVVNHTTTMVVSSNPEYEKCMKESFNDKEACKQYLSDK